MLKQDHFFKLSILLVTYNHEKYISKALNSLFEQKFDGPIEIVVADDASTDTTLALIKSYEGTDSRFHFKYLDYSSNLGITKNYQRGFAACSGEYIAVLEGDDYWIRTDKLKQQAEFLDKNWLSNLCSHNYFIQKEDSSYFKLRMPDTLGTNYLSASDLIKDNVIGNFSTCMYRKMGIEMLPANLFELRSYDWIVNICMAENNMIGFLNEPMSVYRLHNSGAWTQIKKTEQIKAQLELIPAYKKLTNGRFDEEFDETAKHLKYSLVMVDSILKYFTKMPNFFTKTLKVIMPHKIKIMICRTFAKSIRN